jgi:hypothetical protein
MTKRHYVKAHKREGKPVNSYIRGSGAGMPFKNTKKLSYTEQFEALQRESKQIEDERFEKELAQLQKEYEKRNRDIDRFYHDEMENVREELAHKIPDESERKICLDKKANDLFGIYFDEINSLDRNVSVYKDILNEIRKKMKDDKDEKDKK